LVQSKAELLSLQQLRCFCAALELGSFTAAAGALRVSQPAVAEQIRKLEQALGADLFVRAGRGVVATEAGRAFAEHATRSLRALEDAADSVGELTALRSGTVALGIFGEPSAWRMDELVAAFLRRHQNVTVRLIGRNSSAIVERVRRGELEGGVVLLPIDDDKLDVRPIVRDEVLYVSASPERTRRPATIGQLARTPLVFYDAESGDNDPIRRQLASARRLSASTCNRRSRWSSRTSRCDSSPPASATPTSPAPTPTRLTTPRVSAPRRSARRYYMTPSPSSPAPGRGSRPACANSSPTSRRTCAPLRTNSTGHVEQARHSSRSSQTSRPFRVLAEGRVKRYELK
jgi:DNA-binding transcriptional LysR family regulator